MGEVTREELATQTSDLHRRLGAGERVTRNTRAALELCADGYARWCGDQLILTPSGQSILKGDGNGSC